MGSRGQKRAEMVDELPADKRACNSLDFRPGSSNSSNQSHLISTNSSSENYESDMDTNQKNESDMDTFSSASGSSEGELERDSAYGSYDSDDVDLRSSLKEYQRRKSSSDLGKLKSISASLSEETDSSRQLVMLTELCEVLSFCTANSLSGMMADLLSPVLVKLAMNENNPDMTLLAIRAITYLCEVFPQSSGFLVRHDAIPVLCQRLMAIEYLDLAEQCLQALEKLSRDQPLACLNAGAIMAVLTYIDFFSTSVQRVAVSIVVNICKKLPSECPAPFLEAVPVLCNLLKYEDLQLVENVAVCLIKIAERISHSSEMLDELCKHGLIHQATNLISINGRTALSQPIYNSLVGLLVKLCSGSVLAFKTLYELNVSGILKDILSTYDLSHGVSSPYMVDGHCNQVHEVLKLLNELVPTSARDQFVQQLSDKESFLVDHPHLLQKFGVDIFPILIKMVNSGANIYVCYGCLSVINKYVYQSKSDMLVELLQNANIPSFLAGVFTRKDQHVLILALQITEIILQKHPDLFLSSFIKEGVLFAIDALLSPENFQHMIFPVFNGIQLPVDSSQRSTTSLVCSCLCYAFDTVQHTSVSETKTCKLEKDRVQDLAKHIRTSYFTPEVCDSEKGLTDILQKLRTLSTALSDLMNKAGKTEPATQDEENFYCILHQIVFNLSGRESVSTFEFIESGIVRSILNYISNGYYLIENVERNALCSHFYVIAKRFEVFARLFLSSSDTPGEGPPTLVLIQKLQNALSSLESFPVILTHASRLRNSFVTVPSERSNKYPSLRVRFVRGDGESCLSDYSGDVATVDPFSSLNAIEGYLWPKVGIKRNEERESTVQVMEPIGGAPAELGLNANSCSGDTEPDSMSTALREMQVDEANLSPSTSEQVIINSRERNPGQITLDETRTASAEQELQFSSEVVTNVKSENPGSCSITASSPKLVFYLEGEQLDRSLTIYQAILQQQIKLGDEVIAGAKLWSQVYTITYGMAVKSNHEDHQISLHSVENFPVSNNFGAQLQNSPFLSRMFASRVASDLNDSNPTYDILFLLKILEGLNRFASHLISHKRICAFAEGLIDDLDDLRLVVPSVAQNEFICSKLTEKLEQQMRDNIAVSVGGMPLWCNQLMASCPFLFSFEAKCKYFQLSAFGRQQLQPHVPSRSNLDASRDRRSSGGSLPRKKFLVLRDHILESAATMMDLHAHHKVIEVEYNEEVGTGLGPTLEFYTLVCHEFQKPGLGMWRADLGSFTTKKISQTDDLGVVMSSHGLFPCPWPSTVVTSNGMQFSELEKRFYLLGQVVAKALQDGRVLDLPFSKAFYKLILGQDLSLYDIQSFDPELGRTLLEFQALVNRKKHLNSCGNRSALKVESCYRNTRIEDLYLDFTLPGYPFYVLTSGPDHKMVNIDNLENYIMLVVDATVHSGISRKFEAFKSGFNQVFPIEHLQIFTEEELERLLCGECDFIAFNELLDNIKFDHGYTASSPPVISLLEIIQEFDYEQRRAFLQFVTGAPRLPPGGLASLNPKLTIVRKHCSGSPDGELPSVMTCANYVKLPPYSSKEKMKEKLLYAITEGQGSFHLS
ncbi:E3 ubiquitin-protein ligase UPL4-like isoform X1 [Tripterygium wilfordii]|uniref:E3 ubiquitin-protein ligase UPL4-like isoform X1 n=1 Tax=Tripterygium wilfordii TaxID=458696 RepID=UPI0018F82524|nr:E3 ubiquitin-protein ligase UPL4-like isoform X1 [Tripterygium wilfordii]